MKELLLALALVLAPPALNIDISASLVDDHLLPETDNITLKVKIKSAEEYRNLHINVSIPTGRNLEVLPEEIDIDIIGEGETRGDYTFRIYNRGQDPGSYTVWINVYDDEGNIVSRKAMVHVGEKTPGFGLILAILSLLILLTRKLNF
jgi:hypothetical protein